MTEQSCLIDGFGPVPVVRPDTVSGLGELVARQPPKGTALYPFGGQTHARTWACRPIKARAEPWTCAGSIR